MALQRLRTEPAPQKTPPMDEKDAAVVVVVVVVDVDVDVVDVVVDARKRMMK